MTNEWALRRVATPTGTLSDKRAGTAISYKLGDELSEHFHYRIVFTAY
jgi:hypothetical protein